MKKDKQAYIGEKSSRNIIGHKIKIGEKMSSIGYKPKFYDCTIEGIKCIKGKNYFILKKKQSDDIGTMPIQVDQPSELIINRMKEILVGKRDKLYLTRGMRDIDVSYIGDNKWQLFDEFDIYEFEMVI